MKKKEVTLFVFIIVILTSLGYSQVQSQVNIPNSAPILVGQIPNFTWGANNNLVDALNLSQYFIDYNGDTINFSVTNNTEILIVINQSSSLVSFYPNFNFVGTEVVTFTAQDEQGSTDSNFVYLNVGTDNEAPQWSDVSNHNNISQNDNVQFSTDWTDNVNLLYYVFSISQNGQWVNYSTNDSISTNFSGTSNTSSYTIKISAAPGSTVYWKFYAYDTSLNVNVTSTQEFVIDLVPSTSPGGGSSTSSGSGSSSSSGGGGSSSIGRSIGSFFESIGASQKPYDFVIDPTSINVETFQGDSRSVYFTVRNTGTKNLSIQNVLREVDDIVTLNNQEFDLDVGETKEVLLEINIPENYAVGQYFGSVRIFGSGNATKTIPLVILVNEFDPFIEVEVNVDDSSKLVPPGKNVFFDIDVTQTNFQKQVSAKLYTAVKDYSGTIYDSSEKDIDVGVQASFSESLNIPEGVDEGDYLVYVRVEYENRSAIDSDLFEVGYRFKFSSFLRITGTFFYIFILAIVFTLLAVNYERKKKKEKLLNLYLLLSQMKDKLKNNDLNSAAEIYIKIKTLYGQKVPVDLANDKEFLKGELSRLTKVIENSALIHRNVEESTAPDSSGKEENKSSESNSNDSKKEGEESNTPEKGNETSSGENNKTSEDSEEKQKKDDENNESGKKDSLTNPVSSAAPGTITKDSSPTNKPESAQSEENKTPVSVPKKTLTNSQQNTITPQNTTSQPSSQQKSPVKKVVKKIIKKKVVNKNLKEGES